MNQILVSKKIYVTKEMKRKRRLYKTTYILSIIIIFALLVYYVFAERMRNNQEALGKEILSKLNDNTTISENAIVVALDNDQEEEENIEIMPTNNENSTSGQNTEEITTSDGNKYTTEAILSYQKLGINYPVLSNESDKLLKVSLCKY